MSAPIKAIYDYGDSISDRYTIVLNERDREFWVCLGLSRYPEHPQGFSSFSSCMVGRHLGKKIKLKDLPENVQRHIEMRLRES